VVLAPSLLKCGLHMRDWNDAQRSDAPQTANNGIVTSRWIEKLNDETWSLERLRIVAKGLAMAINGVILDVDGTLVLSNDAHARAWVAAFSEHGYDIGFEQVRPLIGMGGDKLIPTLLPDLTEDAGDGKAIAERRKHIFASRYSLGLMPAAGARDLVEHLQRAGLKLIVASSARREELDMLLKAAEVDDLLTEATTSSDAEESKPDPDIVAVALGRLGLAPEQAVMIGDTPYDIEAARGCGIATIAVRCGGWNDDELHGALAIYNDPADLLARYDSSPLAGRERTAHDRA
jgi:HAD superfamily hydrolase (TIGR01509 family)